MVAPGIVGIPAGPLDPVIVDRLTRGNRHLWYRLEVIQQPERARACGAGPKSSADRRPVDPPPVVELRIFEGPTLDHAKDITFTYNSNFFLFATLEHSRILAHGRVQAPLANTPPVLTGMPVSGMAYLDRPQEAGYFLFPDLSVRHEGRYRLTFNLYEQTKEPADLDKESGECNKLSPELPESFDWRMEVKSNEFMVFSAKKFPGLTESTALSRTVAEQGCRVRIRRDVRMRRREGKSAAAAAAAAVAASSAGSINGEDEYSRRHRTQTPEVAASVRARSLSTDSVNRVPFRPDSTHTQRRPSMSEFHRSSPSPQAGPSMPPAFSASNRSQILDSAHLYFGGSRPTSYSQSGPSSVPPSPTYANPSHPFSQMSPTHQQQHQPPLHHQQQHQSQHQSQHQLHHHQQQHQEQEQQQQPQPSQQRQHSPAPQHAHSHSSSQSYYADHSPAQHYSTAPAPPPSTSASAHSANRESLGSVEYRRMSGSYPPPLATDMAVDRRSAEVPRQIPPMVSPTDSKPMTLPSLSEMMSFHDEKNNVNGGGNNASSSSANGDRVPSLSHLLRRQSILPAPASSSSPSTMINKKRSYGQFNSLEESTEGYLANGGIKNHARQSTAIRDYDEMWWKRADGSVWSAQGEVNQPRA